MPFSQKFCDAMSEYVSFDEFDEIANEILQRVKSAVSSASNLSKSFDENDVIIYEQGSYLNKVNVDFNAKLEFVVELKKSSEENYYEMQYNSFNVLKQTIVKVKPKFSLKQFKNCLFASLINEFVNCNVIKTKHSITIEAGEDVPLTVEICPAFSFNKTSELTGKKQPCVLIYDEERRQYIISYPMLHSKNLNEKDELTNYNTKNVIRFFKNMRRVINQNNLLSWNVPGYFIDCLVYNIPNEILAKENFKNVVVDCLNFLYNADLNNFVCVHGQFKMFGNNNDQWEIAKARQYINALVFAYLKLKC